MRNFTDANPNRPPDDFGLNAWDFELSESTWDDADFDGDGYIDPDDLTFLLK